MKLMILVSAFCLLIIASCKKDEIDHIPENLNNTSTDFQPLKENIQRNTASEKIIEQGENVYITGFTQSGNRQNAYALKLTNDAIIWSRYYDKSPDDSRGEALIVNQNDLYIVFSCTGGNTDLKASTGAFQMSYGSGGGPKISFLARIDALTGELSNGTFIGCKLNNGNTNTLRKEDANPSPISIMNNGLIKFRATKAYDRGDGRLTPSLGPDEDCKISGGKWEGHFDKDLKLIWGDCEP